MLADTCRITEGFIMMRHASTQVQVYSQLKELQQVTAKRTHICFHPLWGLTLTYINFLANYPNHDHNHYLPNPNISICAPLGRQVPIM